MSLRKFAPPESAFWVALFFLTLVVWLAVPMWIAWMIPAQENFDAAAARGQFGDMFGAANALFAGLAFVGAFYSLRQQRKELQLQREQLALQQKELAESNAHFDLQNKILKQQFETAEEDRKEARHQAFLASLPGLIIDAEKNPSLTDRIRVIVTNAGAPIRNVRLYTPLGVRSFVYGSNEALDLIPYWKTGDVWRIDFSGADLPDFAARITFEFETLRGETLYFPWILRRGKSAIQFAPTTQPPGDLPVKTFIPDFVLTHPPASSATPASPRPIPRPAR